MNKNIVHVAVEEVTSAVLGIEKENNKERSKPEKWDGQSGKRISQVIRQIFERKEN